MKILHIISSGGMYGAEAVILNLSRALNEAGHGSVLGVFANRSQPNVQLHEVALGEGIESHTIPCAGQMDRTVPGAIRELAASVGADVVHAHGYKADVYVWLALRGRGTAMVATCHTWVETDLATRLYGWLDRWVLESFDGVVAVSAEVKARLVESGTCESAVREIRNGIDLRAYGGGHAKHAAPVVGLVGRLSGQKGVDLFLTMAAEVLVERPTTRFVVAGDGPDREALESLIVTLGIGGSVALVGRQEDMPALYASLDVLVMPSRAEGLPMALLEAMASGLPVVATAVGEVPAVVVDEETGFLVSVGDGDGLTERLLTLLRSPELRARFGAAGRRRIEERFSAERMSGEYLALYREVARS